jgi:glycerol kinase
LETIPFQIRAVLEAMQKDTGLPIQELMVNGGITANNFVMEFLADLLSSKVIKSTMPDVSALGAAYLAALGVGVFKNLEEVQQLFRQRPSLASGHYPDAEQYYSAWNNLLNK